MRSLPIPTTPSKTFPTVYRAWWFNQPGMLARINGVITFRSDAGAVSEHSLSEMRYMVTDHIVGQYDQEYFWNHVYWWREGRPEVAQNCTRNYRAA